MHNHDIERKLIEQEHDIYHTNFTNDYQSFIVHTNNELHHHYNGFSNMIPFYPYNLTFFFYEKEKNQDLLSKSDKFVIIKEIAIGMNQLHEHQIFNIGLSEESIYINKNKDSYIGHFFYDIDIEKNPAKIPNSFYCHHPDIIEDINEIIKCNFSDDKDKEKIKKYIKYDIYSFGVLVFSIFSNQRINTLMHNRPRHDRIDIIINRYKEFLLNSLDFKNDEDLNGIKKFIEKCMDVENSNSYSNFNEVIEDIDFLILNLPQKMKQEIDNRINNAEDANTYECGLSDIIEIYYKGKADLKYSIDRLISLLKDDESDKQIDFISQILRILKLK